MGFVYENNLTHQINAISSVLSVFKNADIEFPSEKAKNPIIRNVGLAKNSNIIDIAMETGTGKTYTYTKLMFELNKKLGVKKFIIAVPSVAIKAGSVAFLGSSSTKEHFRDEYEKNLQIYEVRSVNATKKKKKADFPQSVKSFVEADDEQIHVLIINAGMINSPTMKNEFDRTLFDEFSTPFSALSACNPFLIVDEPHKFDTKGVTWGNIEKFNAQFRFRFGATFNDKFENLVYTLNAMDAFKQNLVKGVEVHISDFSLKDDEIFIKLTELDGKIAEFEKTQNGKKSKFSLEKGDELSLIDENLDGIFIANLNKSVVVLSNGNELRKNEKINPYRYCKPLSKSMLITAIDEHFRLEKDFLNRDIKIKPLSLFFIDDIKSYRNENESEAYLKNEFEAILKAKILDELKTADGFYKEYLQKSLANLSDTHGGYFSQDNSANDEKIEQEIGEILHDKESLLSLNNTRRFIFSKWTLKEGWDNPNVFTICKLRTSGSDTSRLQEVGRGLRLPVNEYMQRIKNDNFFLHYVVDMSERDFAQRLVGEIGEASGVVENSIRLDDEMIKRICEIYEIDDESLLENLYASGITKMNREYKDGGFEKIKEIYGKAFASSGLKNKIRNANSQKEKKKTKMRVDKYAELRQLWENINQKMIFSYKVADEQKFGEIFGEFCAGLPGILKESGIEVKHYKIDTSKDKATIINKGSVKQEIISVSTMSYVEFVKNLGDKIFVHYMTLHEALQKIREFDISRYFSMQNIDIIKKEFKKFLLANAVFKTTIGSEKLNKTQFFVDYLKLDCDIHPTKFTDKKGNPLSEIDSANLGDDSSDESVAESYLFDELYYDSELEKQNIQSSIDEVIVFTKIPRRSIKIAVAGGETYSPDFAYIVKFKNGKILNLIVETKNKDEKDLMSGEKMKITHAKALFEKFGSSVIFKEQFEKSEIVDIIKKYQNF
ncbi:MULTISPECIES: type III restriction-modification system endonuclease [unclassified Campylobacter]|uniref:type III restriction-modification system endonuclease n=1 Tax=unclassified Campylobacter TaxID=2593542 RepID=UPI0022EA0402|nr:MULTISPECIES: type III restriction-modification system endonuclease [unclassified Campylobacter]MDA3079920.1 type III restriction-modification system endonuclease [Campylobacter sp. CS_NA2]MDA3081320.1 type III restriction-modification system endonuclease [Campylobacter sp. CS_NA1]MDA3086020.1 type III restriction-modification system endonuclease [Campylobacter sp. CS_ED1]MDA3090753.1 type III restriction-modification system endonuclease [Campylobacter sp. CS_ED2]WBR51959.1 type III restric